MDCSFFWCSKLLRLLAHILIDIEFLYQFPKCTYHQKPASDHTANTAVCTKFSM